MNKQIDTSNTPIYTHIVSIFFGGVLLMAVSGSVLRWINNAIVAFEFQPLINLVRLIFLLGTLLAMLLALVRSKKYIYELSDDGVIIRSGGLRGRNELYRYKDMKGVSISRGFLGGMQHYGDIVISFGGIEASQHLTLHNIEYPDEVVRYINMQCGLKA